MRILVTDGENRASLAITRSLGRAGHHVFVGEKTRSSLAQASRYCVERVLYDDPVFSPDGFVDSLADAVRTHQIDVLLPVTDITTFLVTRNRARFGACAVPFADADIVELAADKIALMESAAHLGVPAPRSVVVSDPGNVPQTDFSYPLVIKPRQSRVRTGARWVSTSVGYAHDREGLLRDLAARSPHDFPLMLQERIIGPGVGVFACYHEGRPIALFSHRRLRERPPWGGVSVLAESIPMCPLARESAIRLLDGLKWHGVAMVEFKRDVRDGVPKLMEINGRFWGSLQLAVDSGVDFPRLLVQGVETGRFEPQPAYRVGVRTRWLWGDVDSLLVSLFASAAAPEPPRRLRAAIQFLKFFGAGLHYDNPKWSDPMPFLFESYAWCRRTIKDALRSPGNPLNAPNALDAGPLAGSRKHR
jgi:predicted ATP-grasp superfamily ATP-dependent carboligase